MVKSVFATAIFGLAVLSWGSAGAYAASFCTAPVPPPRLNGATATADQLRAAVDKARAFIGQANLYENCLRAQLQAAQTRSSDPAAVEAEKVRIVANRHLKDKVSSETATAMTAYKKAHVK